MASQSSIQPVIFALSQQHVYNIIKVVASQDSGSLHLSYSKIPVFSNQLLHAYYLVPPSLTLIHVPADSSNLKYCQNPYMDSEKPSIKIIFRNIKN